MSTIALRSEVRRLLSIQDLLESLDVSTDTPEICRVAKGTSQDTCAVGD